MLQLISGKFFSGSNKYEYDAKGILFSNCKWTWYKPIKTNIGTLEAVDYNKDVISAFVFNYKNQIEKSSPIVRCGDDEILEQFRVICSFGLKGYFSKYREDIIKTCFTIGAQGFPIKQFVKDKVEPNHRLQSEDIDNFIKIINRVISLERKSYKRIISTLKSILDSIETIGYNIDLAYSMLVYCLESLAQGEENYQPIWENWDQNIRSELDTVFEKIPEEQSTQIKKILLKDKQLKLQQRFLDFIKTHTKDSFFIHEAERIQIALRNSHMEEALRNSYQMRSKFVHELKPIQNQLSHPAFVENDVFIFNNKPYLTYNGLFRLTNHVLENHIYSLPIDEKEKLNYRDELPGKIEVKLAPQYWIWKPESLNGQTANKFLSALIGQLEADGPLTDMTDVMKKIKEIFKDTPREQKGSLLYLFWLYNSVIQENLRINGWEDFISSNMDFFSELKFENIAIRTIGNAELIWGINSCIQVYKQYLRSKYKKNSFALPPLTESAVLCAIANKALKDGFIKEYDWLIKNAIKELSGKKGVQDYISLMMKSNKEIDIRKLLTWFKTPNTEQCNKT